MALFERHRGLWSGLRPAGSVVAGATWAGTGSSPLRSWSSVSRPRRSTWSGAALDGSWMDAGNWDVPPAAGNDLVFPAGAMSQTNTDDLPGQTPFNSLTVQSSTTAGGYSIGAATGSSIALTGTLPLEDSSPSSVVDSILCRSSSTTPRP